MDEILCSFLMDFIFGLMVTVMFSCSHERKTIFAWRLCAIKFKNLLRINIRKIKILLISSFRHWSKICIQLCTSSTKSVLFAWLLMCEELKARNLFYDHSPLMRKSFFNSTRNLSRLFLLKKCEMCCGARKRCNWDEIYVLLNYFLK